MTDSTDTDFSQRFLDAHEELQPGSQFRFACHPGVRCFGACCSALNLMLTPYDALRLRRATKQTSRAFVHEYADMSAMPGVGLPILSLHMQDNDAKRCPFSTHGACAVYADRPSACRTYPLGRATRPKAGGAAGEIEEQIFVIREPHCKGFEEASEWNSASWMDDQGLAVYNAFNDRYMSLAASVREAGRLSQQQTGMAGLALYQPDDFQRFLMSARALERLEMTDERRAAILRDDEACLDFGFDWLELTLLGKTDKIRPKE